VLEIDAQPGEKISLLRSAASTDAPVVDLDVAPPTLDELYAHFLGAQEAAQ
jgi:Cu-processing system ATP-binding protein